MRQINTGYQGQGDFNRNFALCMGIVKDNADPAQHGRLKVYIPSIDSKDFKVEDLPWVAYCSPFGGTTADAMVGRDSSVVPGASSYGLWAIPKNGAQVLIGFLEGDPNVRFWMGCFYLPELNRTLPQSINEPPISTEIDESGLRPQQTIPHYEKNLGEAGLGPGSKHWKTRGGFERSVSYPENKTKNKPTTDGYFKKPLEPNKSDSQTISLTSPGRHFLSMHDVDEYCRMRWKTTEGTQIILDDTNERIYISTARGRNWIEIDEGSGKIYFYTAAKFNIHSENDLNLYSSENINIVAKKRINIQSEERAVKIQSKLNTEILSTDANIKLTASRDVHVKTTNGPKGEQIPEKSGCTPPPYAGQPLGFWRDYAEEGGSPTSKIFINSFQGTDVRADQGPIRITAKQNVDVRSMDGGVSVTGNNMIELKSTSEGIKLEGQQALNFKSSSSNINLQATESINFKANNNINGQARNVINLSASTGINVHSGQGLNLRGESVKIGGGDSVSIVAASVQATPEIQLGGSPPGGAGPAADAQGASSATPAEPAIKLTFDKIKPKMIVPKHEDWDRDEDEGSCKTPRNPKYQG